MVDIDTFLSNGKQYEEAVDFLLSESMDPDHDQHYEEELRRQVEEDRKTRQMVVNLTGRFSFSRALLSKNCTALFGCPWTGQHEKDLDLSRVLVNMNNLPRGGVKNDG
jgi:hypothetical protein